MDVSTTNGAKVSISSAGVDTSVIDTTSEFAALTYTEIKKTQSIGDFGDTANMISFTDLSASRVLKLKGSRDAGELQITVAYVADDPGQIAVIAAEKTKNNYGFKIELNDKGPGSGSVNSIFYFAGPVNSAAISVGEADAVVTMTISVPITTPVYYTPGTPGT
jgi:hypothetical protein